MNVFDPKEIIPRFKGLAIVLSLVLLAILSKAAYIMTSQRAYWKEVSDRVKTDSVVVKPNRGNILSCDGQLLAGSLPEYRMYVDFVAISEAGNDSLWEAKADTIALALSSILPGRSKEAFRDSLEKGRARKSRHWPVWPWRVDYNTYKEVQGLPVFRLSPYKGGFHVEENSARRRPYGTLAGRTVGSMYGDKDEPMFGLEQSFDSLLRGEDGLANRRKVLYKYMNVMVKPPVDGCDIVTTIDVHMQDIAEKALADELEEINGNVGVAIVMEVATGDIKAIVNLENDGRGGYVERRNHAVSDLLEPGSVFKTASMMTALDDGVVDTTYTVDTGGGQYSMYGRTMKDHNWTRGGYGTLTFSQILEYSSNIGVSRLIDGHYHNNPEKFVEGIHRLGLADDLKIPLVGVARARIRMPKKDKAGRQYMNWSDTALPWMSIGYETQVPPISTLTFYNAIANGGVMVRPRLVKQVVKDGEVVEDYPVEVLRQKICKDKTLGEIQAVLEKVVSQGLGKRAGSELFSVAGKTGTAQVSQGKAGYKSGRVKYLVSFAGYFPADAPRYSCIVCIQKEGLPASGGSQSGKVFHYISEGVMARDMKLVASDSRDSSCVLLPEVKAGKVSDAGYVLSRLKIGGFADWEAYSGEPVWGRAATTQAGVSISRAGRYPRKIMPDVSGMGARDAVYLIEKRGVRVRLEGRGKVVAQSIAAGEAIHPGMYCLLSLD